MATTAHKAARVSQRMHGSADSAAPFAGRVALVTGAGRAIGRAVAIELARCGASVAVVAMSAARAQNTVEAIHHAGFKAAQFSADLFDLGTVPRLVRSIEDELGEIDILVHNAATVMPLGPTADLDADQILRALTINVASVIALSAAALPGMRRQGWGRIVSIIGKVGDLDSMPGGTVYTACMAAVEAHTVNLASELADTGVTANAVRAEKMGTSLRVWLRSLRTEELSPGDELIARFVRSQAGIRQVDSERSAQLLVAHLQSEESGVVWDAVHPEN